MGNRSGRRPRRRRDGRACARADALDRSVQPGARGHDRCRREHRGGAESRSGSHRPSVPLPHPGRSRPRPRHHAHGDGRRDHPRRELLRPHRAHRGGDVDGGWDQGPEQRQGRPRPRDRVGIREVPCLRSGRPPGRHPGHGRPPAHVSGPPRGLPRQCEPPSCRGGSGAETPTDVVCVRCVLGPHSAQTLYHGKSIRSGARQTTICTGRHFAVRVEPGARAIVDEGNTVLPRDDAACKDVVGEDGAA